ncbi:MAG: methionine adenosyltransferase [Cytophagales bacterium]|nr:methionine adenosyltransferase [Cytophagales bacterium]
MGYHFTSESVSEGHPDKIADQISDNLLDNFLAFDPESRVACETLVTTGQVILAGEVSSGVHLNFQELVRDLIKRVGYTKGEYGFSYDSCGILSCIHDQSPEIIRGVQKAKKEDQGAGDQGMMFGYATHETKSKIPLTLDISHRIVRKLAEFRKNKTIPYLRPDAKTQVTAEYDESHQPQRVVRIVLSTQHDDFDQEENMLAQIRKDVLEKIIPSVREDMGSEQKFLDNPEIEYLINPTGRFVLGGPHGDTGLTGRKIIIDTYGGWGAHGGGAFSGKDPSKVDRSAAYALRHVAKNLVAAGIANRILIQMAYAIGIAQPVGCFVNTYGTARVRLKDSAIASLLMKNVDFTPAAMEKRLNLRTPIYAETAAYGHMGRECQKIRKSFFKQGKKKEIDVELFPWEKLNLKDNISEIFRGA